MPIKYNLTKYDMLAEKIHELAQKKTTLPPDDDPGDEQVLRAEAVLIASFASEHSWQTYKLISDGNPNLLISNSSEIKREHDEAKTLKWKRIRNTEIQGVAKMNIKDGMFYTWLSVNGLNGSRTLYKSAWCKLKEEFSQECDGISIPQR